MSTAMQLWNLTKKQISGWSWLKRSLFLSSVLCFAASSFLFLTPVGASIREFLADTVITTQHRDWAWIFVGAEKRDYLVRKMQAFNDWAASEKQDLNMIRHESTNTNRRNRSIDELVKVEDISGKFWVGKKMTVYDPKTIRVMVPHKQGEGERITSMVQRTGAVAGVNGGGFVDPDGLGNGFAPLGLIMSGGDVIYTDTEGHQPQMVVGFTDEGTLVIGKYSIVELREMHVSEAVSFYPRVIANGKPLITSGDGGWGRGPRTAVGQKEDGTVIFVVIDGRQAHSVGATLKEVQDLLLEEGCVNAGFLDGGASSELVYNGELVTKPSSRYGERRLPSAFLIYDHPEDVKVDRIWDGLDKIDPGGAYDHPDYLREQAELKAKQQANQPKPQPKPEPQQPASKSQPSTTPQAKPQTEPQKPSSSGGTGNSAKQQGETPADSAGGTSQQSTKPPPGGDATTPSSPGAAEPGKTSGSGTSAPPASGGTVSAPATGESPGQPGTGGAQTPSAPAKTNAPPAQQPGTTTGPAGQQPPTSGSGAATGGTAASSTASGTAGATSNTSSTSNAGATSSAGATTNTTGTTSSPTTGGTANATKPVPQAANETNAPK